MKKILKLGQLLAFSVLLFTGCDSIAGNDIDVKTEIIAQKEDEKGRQWAVSYIIMEDDGAVVESISYALIDIPEQKRYGFMISKGNNGVWACTISADNTKRNKYYTGKYSIVYPGNQNPNTMLRQPDTDWDREDGWYTFSINGLVYKDEVTSLAASDLDAISITLNIDDSIPDLQSKFDTIPVNQEFLDAVKKYLLK